MLHLIHSLLKYPNLFCLRFVFYEYTSQIKWHQKKSVTYLWVVRMTCLYLLTMIKPRMLKQYNKDVDSNATIQVFSIRIHTVLLVQTHALCLSSFVISTCLSQAAGSAGIWTQLEFSHMLPAQQQDEKVTAVASSTTVCSANPLQQQPWHHCPYFRRWSASILARA